MTKISLCRHNLTCKALSEAELSDFGLEQAKMVRDFHASLPDYEPTPLVCLKKLAEHSSIKGLYVKDESQRFGLNAFKSLGGTHALAKLLAEKIGLQGRLAFQAVASQEARRQAGDLTFVTATDGNHGRGVAWAARVMGQKAVVYMPKGSRTERLENIRAQGAEASIMDMLYDDTVRFAAKQAEEKGWILVQDTAWEGYEKIPKWIMQGYLTMALETVEQLKGVVPTHVFLQAGVGSMAGAVAAFLTAYYGENKPVITIVEPFAADCCYQTALADDQRLHATKGNLQTIMAGLACGEVCKTAWELLDCTADNFVAMPDHFAADGMRVLGNPLPDDRRIISGESGASTTGLVHELLHDESLVGCRKQIGLDEESVVLLFSTEGDTDKENYRSIVWQGKYPRLSE